MGAPWVALTPAVPEGWIPMPLLRAIAEQLAQGDPSSQPYDRLSPEQRMDDLRMAVWIVRTVNAAGFIVSAPHPLSAPRSAAMPAPHHQARSAADASDYPYLLYVLGRAKRLRSTDAVFALADALNECAAHVHARGGDTGQITTFVRLVRDQANHLPKDPA